MAYIHATMAITSAITKHNANICQNLHWFKIVTKTSVTSTHNKFVKKHPKILTYIQFGNKIKNQNYIE